MDAASASHRGRTGATPYATIEVLPLGKRIHADDNGRFSIRSLPAGELTLIAGGIKRRITLPRVPSTVHVDLGATVVSTK